METLKELVDRVLIARGETVTAFAARLGVNRLTVNRWAQSLPAPDTLRRVAEDLAVPYSRVLAAAMASAGYALSLGDLLSGQQVHLVIHAGDDEPEYGLAAAAFVDETRADAYLQAMSAGLEDLGYYREVAVIDGAEIPETIEVFTTTWSSRVDQIRLHSVRARSVPTRLCGRKVTDVEATALAETGEVFMLQADSLDVDAGHAAITAALDALRKQGRLYPPGVHPVSAVEGWARYVESAQGKYAQPQSRGRGLGLEPQSRPVGFAAYRQDSTKTDGEQ